MIADIIMPLMDRMTMEKSINIKLRISIRCPAQLNTSGKTNVFKEYINAVNNVANPHIPNKLFFVLYLYFTFCLSSLLKTSYPIISLLLF